MSQIQKREGKRRKKKRGRKRGEKEGKDSSRFQRSGGQQGAAAPVGDAARHPLGSQVHIDEYPAPTHHSFWASFSKTFARHSVQ